MSSTRFSLDIFRLLLIAALAAIAVAIVVLTVRWPLVWDAQIFHYSHFLIQNGFTPYRDIPDINFPGVYVLEGWAISLFGGGDLAWRIYDFALLIALTLAMIVVSRPYDWLAGLFGGVAFALLHANDGPWNSAERDEIMIVLALIAYACLFESLRRRRPSLFLGFGLSFGLAMTIKPTVAPLGILLWIMAVWKLRHEHRPTAASTWYGLAGALIAVFVPLVFLLHHHALFAFVHDLKSLVPFYTRQEHTDLATLLRFLPKKLEAVTLPFAVAVAIRQSGWKSWERAALWVGIAFGAISYLQQAKGYDYHRYPFAAFLLLWISIELALAMRQPGWRRWIGATGFAAGLIVAAPLYLRHVAEFHAESDVVPLQEDLVSLGADRLQHQIQCIDLVQGCFAALYHLKLVQSTGMLGDILIFSPEKSPVVESYRDWYWKQLIANPPAVIVVTNEWFGRPPSFDKINQWPNFAGYLRDHYNLTITRKLPDVRNDAARIQAADHQYRIYIRKDLASAMPRKAG